MINADSIPPKKETRDALDFHFLKQLATQRIQSLTGRIWTDYNVHDPGETLLEILCYAITDLGFRNANEVPDLLATARKSNAPSSTFYHPAEILTTAPTTETDYRKLFLTVDGIKNVRMMPSLTNPDFIGIYDVYIELEDMADKKEVESDVLELYHSNKFAHSAGGKDFQLGRTHSEVRDLQGNRCLCEDIDKIIFLETTKITFNLDIEVEPGTHVNKLVGDTILALKEYLSPTIVFHQIQDLVAKGMRSEEIFNGPRLPFGSIMDDELADDRIRSEILASDLVNLIMGHPDVVQIRQLKMIDSYNITYDWICPVERGKTPVLDTANSTIRLYDKANILILSTNLEGKRDAMGNYGNLKATHKMEMEPPGQGTFLNLQDYYSIQYEFPKVYGIGEQGLSSRATPRRKAQAKQFKGFLMLFDQILANFLAQLSNLNQLFSLDDIGQTYFSQPLLDFPGAHFMYRPFVTEYLRLHANSDNESLMRLEWDLCRSVYQAWLEYRKVFRVKRSNPEEFDQHWRTFAENYYAFGDFRKAHSQDHPKVSNLDEAWRSYLVEYRNIHPNGVNGPDYLESVRKMDDLLYESIESEETFLDRRNRFLDHLLARFAIDINDFSYTNAENPDYRKSIETKLTILKNLPYLSKARGVGMDLQSGLIEEPESYGIQGKSLLRHNFSGVEETLYRLLGIEQVSRTPLKDLPGDLISVDLGEFPDAPDAGRLEIQLYGTDKGKAVDNLFRYGIDHSNYYLTQDKSALELRVNREDGFGNASMETTVARFRLPSQLNEDDVHEFSHKIIDKLVDTGRKHESLHLVEHVLLRPPQSSCNFGFAIHDPLDGSLLFESNEFLTFSDREDTIREALNLGRDPQNYTLHVTAYTHIRIALLKNGLELYSPKLYTPEEAEEQLEKYALAFRKLYLENTSRNNTGKGIFKLVSNLALEKRSEEEELQDLFEAASDARNYGVATDSTPFAKVVLRSTDKSLVYESRRSIFFHASLYEVFRIINPGMYKSLKAQQEADFAKKIEEFKKKTVGFFREFYMQNVYANSSIKFFTRRREILAEVDDPYSQIVSVVMPSWPSRFQHDLFRSFIERLIRMLVPVQLGLNITWLSFDKMAEFEELYASFLQKSQQLRRDRWQAHTENHDEDETDNDDLGGADFSAAENEIAVIADKLLLLITENPSPQ